MIRIPFFDQAEVPGRPSTLPLGRPAARRAGRSTEIDARLNFLETKLASHAEEIHEGVNRRVERIESRVRRAMLLLVADAQSQEEEADAGNVVEFSGSGSSLHHLPALSAIDAMKELNETLDVTRKHLDALASSVRKIRETCDP